MSRQVIIRNSVRCRRCGDEIVSEHRHDFERCACGRVAVDGGQTWLRRIGDLSLIEDTSIVRDDDGEQGLEMMRRRAARADPAAVLKLLDQFGNEPPELGDEIDE